MNTEQAKPARISQVASMLENQTKALEQLHASISKLNERLGPVLNIHPRGESDKKQEAPSLVPLASIIRESNSSIRTAIERIELITSSLEL